jgi:hypothetical protein
VEAAMVGIIARFAIRRSLFALRQGSGSGSADGLDQSIHSSPDIIRYPCEPRCLLFIEIFKTLRYYDLRLEFENRSAGVKEEPPEIFIGAASLALGYVARDRNCRTRIWDVRP